MLGSDTGHKLQQKLLGIDKIRKGQMLIYQGQESNKVRDYISSLAVIENDKTVAEKNVEVNHPLHYGGYYFYQYSYDAQAGQYSVLMVVSDTGLGLVYAGYVMLCAGVIWHFWLRDIFKKTRKTPYGN